MGDIGRLPKMSEQNSSFPALRVPVIDPKTGQMTWTWTQWFIDAQNRLQNGLDQLGQLIGGILATAVISGRTEGIGTTVQHLSDTGVIDSSGMTAASPEAQGAVVLASGASGNKLGSAAMEDSNAFDLAGSATSAQANAEAYADEVGSTTLASAKSFSSDASNISSGNLALGRMPVEGLSGVIVTAALTTLGTQGSMTFTNGVLTAHVDAT